MEWSGMEWNKESIPLLGYFIMERNKITTPSFENWTE